MNIAEYSERGLSSRVQQAAAFRLLTGARDHWEARRVCADLIERAPECVARVDVHELLESCRDVGVVTADAWQAAAGLFEAISVGDLDPERRAALVALLRFRSPARRP